MKNLLLIALFILSSTGFAQSKFSDNKEIRSTVLEASNHLKLELTRELKQSIDLREFTLSVQIKVDEKKLRKTLGVSEEDWSKLEDMQLPGLFVEGKEGYAQSAFEKATKEDILISLKDVKVNIIYYQDNYTQDFISDSLKRIVVQNVPNIDASQIEVMTSLEAAPYRSKNEESLAKVLSKPLEVNVKSGAFQSFWDNYYKFIIAAASLALLGLGVFLASSLKGGLGTLADVIRTKTLSSTGSNAIENRSSPSQENFARSDFSGDAFESYVQANEYLASMVTKEPKVFEEVIMLKVIVEDYPSLVTLLDVVAKDKREAFINNIEADKKARFKEFIVNQGHAVFQNESVLKEEAIKTIKLIKRAALSPDELYQMVVTDFVTGLDQSELGQLLKLSTPYEKSFITNLLGPNQMALMLQTDMLTAEELEIEPTEMSESEILDILMKFHQIRGTKKFSVRKEKLESVYAQVETGKAEILADAMGLETELRFETLFARFQDSGLKYLEGMNYEKLSKLYPLLTEMMQTELLKALPELLGERLKLTKKTVTADSLKEKGDFYFYLRALADTEMVESVPTLKLAA